METNRLSPAILKTEMARRNVIRERNGRGLSLFLQNLKGVTNLFLAPQEIDWTSDLVEQTAIRLQDAYATLTLMEHDVPVSSTEYSQREHVKLLMGHVKSLHNHLTSFDDELCITNSAVHYSTQVVSQRIGEGPGRPCLDITKDQIEFLRSLHFSWEKIASLLQISVSTLQRRRKAFGLSEDLEQYSDISDEELDQLYKELTVADASNSTCGGFLTPNLGRRRFIGSLRSRGIRIQRWRASQCIRRVDPIGTALRWRLVIHRRKYNVPTPNSLWHFDSSHKLIRWKLVVHVCIDGFSRLLIYCRCCDNNRADTVLELFQQGTQLHGVPSRARCDYGMENFFVAQFMLEQRGLDRGSIITGSSVHNCRVERTHRDVYEGVLCFYARLFNEMEMAGIVDPLNDIHLYCLHCVFLPRINRSLQEFVSQMNNRPISTEGNQSPLQLWTSGMLQNINSHHTALTDAELENYGFDPEGLVPVADEDYQVQFDAPTSQLTAAQASQLPNPLANDGVRGQNVYMQYVEYLMNFQELED